MAEQAAWPEPVSHRCFRSRLMLSDGGTSGPMTCDALRVGWIPFESAELLAGLSTHSRLDRVLMYRCPYVPKIPVEWSKAPGLRGWMSGRSLGCLVKKGRLFSFVREPFEYSKDLDLV